MRRTRATEASDSPQRLRSLRVSHQNPLLSPHPVTPLRRSSRRSTPATENKRKLVEDHAASQEVNGDQDKDNTGDPQRADQLTDYERKRRENIQRNLAFMQQMGVSTAKIAARTAVDDRTQVKKQQAGSRGVKTVSKAKPVSQPMRKSRRLEGKMAEVQPMESIDRFEIGQRQAPRPSRSSQLHVMETVDRESKAFLGSITDKFDGDEVEEDCLLEDEDGIEYSLADNDIVKAVQERIYSVAFLPRADHLVIACGDKVGHVALWTPSTEANTEPSVSMAVYRPHSTPVSQLVFPDSSKLISSSFDGTVREFDLRAAASVVVYDTNDGAGISSLALASTPHCYYVSCDDGTVRWIDRRVQGQQSSKYQLHERKINTVHAHPHLGFCVATASLDRTVCLWDARMLAAKKPTPLVTLPHYRSVNCAYFSPRNGAWMVTVGQDSYIDMFDTSSLTSSAKAPISLPDSIRVRHNNVTGRWLTKFHAAWDPKRPNQFVIGCLEQPRRIQIFRAGRRRPVRELQSPNFASVHSINAFHPHLELIAGGNSSGRLALWRGKKVSETN
ncbi:hypothetical protein PsorP6_011792 [Peronosclerospora sorghi]|uniref:Uncharacterized protein n=1 Tax=Peronosclerospora sorghi TaxID=230839 RepID=A0ACC0WKZ9_9STRA|nr:hypothetical protein PsorP6_011792 [Peronosclerospora sorghi]